MPLAVCSVYFSHARLARSARSMGKPPKTHTCVYAHSLVLTLGFRATDDAPPVRTSPRLRARAHAHTPGLRLLRLLRHEHDEVRAEGERGLQGREGEDRPRGRLRPVREGLLPPNAGLRPPRRDQEDARRERGEATAATQGAEGEEARLIFFLYCFLQVKSWCVCLCCVPGVV